MSATPEASDVSRYVDETAPLDEGKAIGVYKRSKVAALTGTALAQTTDTYPDRPIKVVVPAAAGGVTDTPALIVTNRMRDNLGQTLVIENQGGAGGILAAESVKRAAPDGYTLLYVNAATHGLLPALKKSHPKNFDASSRKTIRGRYPCISQNSTGRAARTATRGWVRTRRIHWSA